MESSTVWHQRQNAIWNWTFTFPLTHRERLATFIYLKETTQKYSKYSNYLLNQLTSQYALATALSYNTLLRHPTPPPTVNRWNVQQLSKAIFHFLCSAATSNYSKTASRLHESFHQNTFHSFNNWRLAARFSSSWVTKEELQRLGYKDRKQILCEFIERCVDFSRDSNGRIRARFQELWLMLSN